MANLRQMGFWALDGLRGGPVHKAHQLAVDGITTHDPASLQAGPLDRLLSLASTTTTAYSGLHGAPLSAYPVVDKGMIRDRPADFTCTAIDPAAMHRTFTSGSTGTPFSILQNPTKRHQARADTIVFGSLAGFELGTPIHYIRVWSERLRLSPLKQWAQNMQPYDVLRFEYPRVEKLLIDLANTRRPCGIVAYGSSLGTMARHIDEIADTHGLDLSRSGLSAMISQSEAFAPEARAKLAEHFTFWPVARYAIEEVGIIGQQIDAGSAYRINSASILVEVLDVHDDQPARPGELGRIVVTDLRNTAMPMIRYDTGDLGRFGLGPDGTLDHTELAVVEGRRLDQIYDADDRPVSSFLFLKHIWRFPTVRGYQLVQEGKGRYLVKINTDGPFSTEDEEALAAGFAAHLGGSSADVRTERTDELPVLDSGKRRAVVSNYTPGTA